MRTWWDQTKKILTEHKSFLISFLICVAVFSWFVTEGTFQFVHDDAFGPFYGYQAQSLMQGHLDVPKDAISYEAFVFDGKSYGYFGITPALFRIPLLPFDPLPMRSSRIFMLLFYMALLVSAYLSLLEIGRSWKSSKKTGIFASALTLGVGLGSPAIFLSSVSCVYFEAILCGAALALLCSLFAIRYYRTDRNSDWIAALVIGALAVNARPSSGLYALTLLGFVALLVLIRKAKQHGGTLKSIRHSIVIILLTIAAALSFHAISYLKFRTWDSHPLQYHILYNKERLDGFGHASFHASNIEFGIYSYILNPNFAVTRTFPYLWLGNTDSGRRYFEGLKLDFTEETLGFVYTSTFLFLLAALGLLYPLLIRKKDRELPLAVALAALPMTILLCAAITISHRYTGDFIAPLVCSACFGFAVFEEDGERRRAMKFALIICLVWSVLVNLSLTISANGLDKVNSKATHDRFNHWISELSIPNEQQQASAVEAAHL